MIPTNPASTRKSVRGKIRANGSSTRSAGVEAWVAVNAPPMVDGSRTSVDTTSACGSLRTIRIAWQTAGSSKRIRPRPGAGRGKCAAEGRRVADQRRHDVSVWIAQDHPHRLADGGVVEEDPRPLGR